MTTPNDAAPLFCKWSQDGDYTVPDVVANALQLWDDQGPRCWPFLGKRYADAQLHLYSRIGIWIRHGEHADAKEFVAVLKCAEARPQHLDSHGHVRAYRAQVPNSERRPCGKEFSVLVWTVEPLQNEQGLRLRGIPSVVRLEALESRNDLLASPFPQLAPSDRPILESLANGERHLLGAGLGECGRVPLRDREGAIIQGCPERIERLPDRESEGNRRFITHRDAERIFTRRHIVLSDRTIRVCGEEFDDFVLHSFQLNVYPPEHDVEIHRFVLEIPL